MANPPPTDPFLSVQSDVHTTLTQTRTLFSSYLRIRTLATSRPSSSKSEELAQARTDLEDNLSTLDNDLADLTEAVDAVEDDPYAFGLDVAEVARRRGFVREVGEELRGMRREVSEAGGGNVAASLHQQQEEEEGTQRGRSGGRLPHPGAFEDGDDDEEDNYAEFEHQQQQTMMAEQDEQLDGVFHSVGRLRNQAEDMGRELEEQGHMLDDVDTLADRVGGKLQTGVKKVGEVIRRNEETMSSCCIGVLILVLVILLILVIVI